jgi:calcium/calmodulin-dependent protein kinase I
MGPNENTSAAFIVNPAGALFSRMALPTAEHQKKIPVSSTQKEEGKLEHQSSTITSHGTFFDFYQLGDRIQSGTFGVVYRATRLDHRDDNCSEQEFAVKVIDRTKLKEKDGEEVGILQELVDVENVITLVDFYANPEKLYVVQQLAAGGDVFGRLIQRKTYTEQIARQLAKILLQTLQVVHKRNIVHRDLKPGNLLLASHDDDFSIMLADFGFAKHLSEEGYCKTRCGTPAYVARKYMISKRLDKGD